MASNSNRQPRTMAKELAATSATMLKKGKVMEVTVERVRSWVDKGWRRVN